MLLAIDIGNTNITAGVYRKDLLGPRWRFSSHHARTSDEFGASIMDSLKNSGIAAEAIHSVAVVSVVPQLTEMVVAASNDYLGHSPLVIDSAMNTGIRSCYDDPKQVGADRIVDAAAAYQLYGGPAVIIDFGTATTFDAVNEAGDFLGGAIVPGIGISSEELYLRAAKLPKVELSRPPFVIGRNVGQSLQSGLLFGYTCLVEGMVARFLSELGANAVVVATGGLAGIIAKETPVITILAPWLTLDGLRIIFERNDSQSVDSPKTAQ